MQPMRYLMGLALTAATPFVFAQDEHEVHAHGHEAHAATDAAPATGKRWAVDAPLQTGMARIRTAVQSLAHHETGHLDAAQVTALATTIEEQVQYLIANCKLDPKADAALHGIIGALLAGAKALKEAPTEAAPVAKLRAALADYPKYFDDPAWSSSAE